MLTHCPPLPPSPPAAPDTGLSRTPHSSLPCFPLWLHSLSPPSPPAECSVSLPQPVPPASPAETPSAFALRLLPPPIPRRRLSAVLPRPVQPSSRGHGGPLRLSLGCLRAPAAGSHISRSLPHRAHLVAARASNQRVFQFCRLLLALWYSFNATSCLILSPSAKLLPVLSSVSAPLPHPPSTIFARK